MFMNLKELSPIKNKLKEFIENKEVLDVILFGSFVKGKKEYADIDVAILGEIKSEKEISGFHLNFITLDELWNKYALMFNTLIREGYSLRHNKMVSEYFRFKSRTLFSYNLLGLSPSEKVKAVNMLRGIGTRKGLVEELGGSWIANQVFTINPENSNIFEKFFVNFKIKFTKSSLLID